MVVLHKFRVNPVFSENFFIPGFDKKTSLVPKNFGLDKICAWKCCFYKFHDNILLQTAKKIKIRRRKKGPAIPRPLTIRDETSNELFQVLAYFRHSLIAGNHVIDAAGGAFQIRRALLKRKAQFGILVGVLFHIGPDRLQVGKNLRQRLSHRRPLEIFLFRNLKKHNRPSSFFLKKYFENRKTTRKLSITPLSSTCSAGLSLPRRSAPLFHRQVICPSPRCPPLLASSTERCFACRA